MLANNNATKRIAPGVTLVPGLERLNCSVRCVNSCGKVRGRLVRPFKVPCRKVSSKGLHHCFDLRGFASPFHIVGNFNRTHGLVGDLGPSIVFSGNNFISIPIILTKGQYGIPIVVRRSSVAPNLTGGLTVPSTIGIYYGFPRALSTLPRKGTILANSPVHRRLLANSGSTTEGVYNFASRGPIVLMVNKDLNTMTIGRTMHTTLPRLLGRFRVVRLYKGKGISSSLGRVGNCYRFRCVGGRLHSLFTLTSIIVSHTNTGTVYRLLTLEGPGLLVPLSTHTDHNSRVLGTRSFRHRKFDLMVRRRRLAGTALLSTIRGLCRGHRRFVGTVRGSKRRSPVTAVVNLVRRTTAGWYDSSANGHLRGAAMFGGVPKGCQRRYSLCAFSLCVRRWAFNFTLDLPNSFLHAPFHAFSWSVSLLYTRNCRTLRIRYPLVLLLLPRTSPYGVRKR